MAHGNSSPLLLRFTFHVSRDEMVVLNNLGFSCRMSQLPRVANSYRV